MSTAPPLTDIATIAIAASCMALALVWYIRYSRKVREDGRSRAEALQAYMDAENDRYGKESVLSWQIMHAMGNGYSCYVHSQSLTDDLRVELGRLGYRAEAVVDNMVELVKVSHYIGIDNQ